MQKKSCKPLSLGRVWQTSRRALALDLSPPHQFACCQWQPGPRPPIAYLLYRWLLFIGVTSTAIASFVCQRLPHNYEGPHLELNYVKWFIYFTNWGFLVIVLQSALALAVVHKYRAERALTTCCDDDTPIPKISRTPVLCKTYWLAQTVAIDLAFVITPVYWTLVHDPKMHEVNVLNVLVHVGNSVVMLIEVAVTAHPVKMAHALYGVGAGLAYGFFSAFYWAVGGTDRIGLPAIYPSLNWNKPGTALSFVALCAIVMVFAHAVASALARARVLLAHRLRPSFAEADRLTLPTH